MATTATTVREALKTLVAALAPTQLPTEGFRRYEKPEPFDVWVAQNPAHCFRTFDLRFLPAAELPVVTNPPDARWRYRFELSVAYPRAIYKGLGSLPVLAIDQVADEDEAQIFATLRDYTGASFVADGWDAPERDDGVGDEVTVVRYGATYELWRTA